MPEVTLVSGETAAAYLPQIAQLHLAAVCSMRDAAPVGYGLALQELPAQDAIETQFREDLAAGAVLCAAVATGQLAGYLQAVVEEFPDDLVAAPYLTIEYVAVSPEFRGQGVARQLLHFAEREAMEHGCSSLELRVMAGNADAIRVYERFGFDLLEKRYAKLVSAPQGETSQS